MNKQGIKKEDVVVTPLSTKTQVVFVEEDERQSGLRIANGNPIASGARKDEREPAWDCTFYKSDRECVALKKMICKKEACKFYKSIHTSD